jgi:hypothetical protein
LVLIPTIFAVSTLLPTAYTLRPKVVRLVKKYMRINNKNTNIEHAILSDDVILIRGNAFVHAILTILFIDVVIKLQLEPFERVL